MQTLVITTLAVLAVIAIAIAFGGPAQLPPMQSVSAPFRAVDFSDLPLVERFVARDGTQLAYRRYGLGNGGDQGSVVLVHGSASRSNSMHALAKGLYAKGHTVFSLDMRGHGESGRKGQISYIGQLEDDIEDFMKGANLQGKKVLVGFSAGGGFALRFAADSRRHAFDSYLLLAPFLGQNARTYRPASGGWVSVGFPRVLGLIVLNRFGISGLNHLAVTAYALGPEVQEFLTPRYSYGLAMNFRPHHNYKADIASATLPMEVLVGENDDQFHAEQFAAEFKASVRQVRVLIVRGAGHMDLTLAPSAIAAAVQAVARLNIRSSV